MNIVVCIKQILDPEIHPRDFQIDSALKKAVQAGENHMPPLLDCIRCYTTEGEITSVLSSVFGTYTEPPLI